MIFHSPKVLSAASAWIPLLYDTVVLFLTLYITLPSIRKNEHGSLAHSYVVDTIFKDGILYYVCVMFEYLVLRTVTTPIDSVIFSVTLVLTIGLVSAPEGTQNNTAQCVVPPILRL